MKTIKANVVTAADDDYKWMKMLADADGLIKHLTDELREVMEEGSERAENAKRKYGGGEIFAANWVEEQVVKELDAIVKRIDGIKKGVKKNISDRWGKMGR